MFWAFKLATCWVNYSRIILSALTAQAAVEKLGFSKWLF